MTADPSAGPGGLETGRTRVRPWRIEEADRFLDTYSRWEVARWLGATPTLLRSRDEAVTRIERWSARTAETPGQGLWAVERKDDGVVAGTVLLVPVPGPDDRADEASIEVGWHLHPDSWGRGFATEAARAVLDRAFAEGLDEAIAVIRPGNTASVSVAARLGMTHEGLTSAYYGTELELFRLASPYAGERPPND